MEERNRRGPLLWPIGMVGSAVLGTFLAFSPSLYAQGRPVWQVALLVGFFAGGSVVLLVAAYKMWMQKPKELWWNAAGFLAYAIAAILLQVLK